MKNMNSVTSSEKYAELLRKQNRDGRFGWSLQLRSTHSKQENLTQLQATLATLGEQRSVQEVINSLDLPGSSDLVSQSFNDRLDLLGLEFQRDIKENHGQNFPTLAELTKVVFLPSRESTAFCLSADDDGQAINGHLICMHEGLYFSAQMLGKALVYSNLSGEYEKYKQSGQQAFNTATAFYLNPLESVLNGMFFRDVPPEVNGALCAMQSKVAIMIMQFVLDHEFGHIANGDLDIQEFNRQYIANAIQTSVSDQARFISWEMEFSADKFALTSMLERSSSGLSACANFITVCLFFLWLEALERRSGINEFKTHPPAGLRLMRLENLVRELISDWVEVSQILDDLKVEISSWTEEERAPEKV
jgi:hypothetical protein